MAALPRSADTELASLPVTQLASLPKLDSLPSNTGLDTLPSDTGTQLVSLPADLLKLLVSKVFGHKNALRLACKALQHAVEAVTTHLTWSPLRGPCHFGVSTNALTTLLSRLPALRELNCTDLSFLSGVCLVRVEGVGRL